MEKVWNLLETYQYLDKIPMSLKGFYMQEYGNIYFDYQNLLSWKELLGRILSSEEKKDINFKLDFAAKQLKEINAILK